MNKPCWKNTHTYGGRCEWSQEYIGWAVNVSSLLEVNKDIYTSIHRDKDTLHMNKLSAWRLLTTNTQTTIRWLKITKEVYSCLMSWGHNALWQTRQWAQPAHHSTFCHWPCQEICSCSSWDSSSHSSHPNCFVYLRCSFHGLQSRWDLSGWSGRK